MTDLFALWRACALGALAVSAVVTTATAEPLPLEVARKLEFQTDEGTWISLDVAPDGRTILFELLGDIYSLDIGGGKARRVLGGLAFETQPSFSPDGRRIAFLSDRSGSENLWIANVDGSDPRQLSKDDDKVLFASPAWSPDGQYVYVSRSDADLGAFKIWMYHVQGGSGIELKKVPESSAAAAPSARHLHVHAAADEGDAAANAMGAMPSADGKYLYFSAKQSAFDYNLAFPAWEIVRRDLVTGQQAPIISAPGSAMKPVISPDGRLLVYATRFDGQTGLRVRTIGSGEDRWLAYPVQRDAQEEVPTRDLLPSFDFTPDGKALILSFDGKIQRLDVATGAKTTIPFTADVSLDIGPKLDTTQRVSDGPVRARIIQSPRQSPDGKRLVFSALGQLYMMDLPSGVPRRLTRSSSAEFHPSWSADGQSIVYITWGAKGGHIWRISAKGGEPQQLTQVAAYYTDPILSTDGRTVIALRSSNHARMQTQEEVTPVRIADIVRVEPGKREPALIAHVPGAHSLHFTADSQRVYFFAGHELQSVRLDGMDRRSHVGLKGPDKLVSKEPVPVNAAKVSPDGRWALAQLATQLYIVALPLTGASNLEIDLGNPSVASRRLTDVGADFFDWADGGKTVTWALGSTFFRRPFDSITFDEPPKDEDKSSGSAKQAPKTPDPGASRVERFTAEITVPRDTPRGTIVLRGATAITMQGQQDIENADILVIDNRIAGVGRRGEVVIPPNAEIRDVTGKYIIPGLIDTHAHWYEIRHGVLDLENWSFLINLAYGVTAGLDVQTFTSDMFVYEDLIDAGRMTGLRAFSTGPGMFSNNRIGTPEDARAVVTRYRDYYGTRNLKSYDVGNRRQRHLVVNAAKELGMLPTTEGSIDVELDLTHAIDGFHGNEHAMPSVPLYKDVVELYARTGIGYTISSMVAYGGPWAEDYFFIHQSPHHDAKVNRFMPHFVNDIRTRRRVWFRDEEQIFPKLAAEAGKIMRAGGRIGVGSHAEFQGLAYHWEMQVLASGGLTPREILRAATVLGSEIIGRPEDLGSLTTGKLADLVILTKNPLDDIRNTLSVEQVMKNGRLYDGDTLDEVWPRRRPMAPAWFRDDVPMRERTGS